MILRPVYAAFLIRELVLTKYSQKILKHADTYLKTSLPFALGVVE